MRKWNGELTKEEMENLDYSNLHDDSDKGDQIGALPQHLIDQSQLGHWSSDGHYEVQDLGKEGDDDEEVDSYDDAFQKNDKKDGGMFSFFKSITGQKELTAQD